MKNKSSKQRRAVPRRRNRNKALARITNGTNCARDFARCVLDPMGGFPAKVPDGACSSVLIEYNIAFTGVPDGVGNLGAICWPGLPCSAGACVGTFVGPNRTGASTTFTVANSQAVMLPFADFPNSTPYLAGNVVYYNDFGPSIRRARAVSYKLEVTPIGTILNQGGAAVTARVPMRIVHGMYPIHDNGVGYSGVGYAGASNHPWMLGASPGSFTFANLSSYPDAKVLTATESTVLIGMPPNYDYVDACLSIFDHGNAQTDTLPLVGQYPTAGTAAGAFGGIYTDVATAGNYAMLPAAAGTDIGLLGNFWQSDTDALVWFGSNLPANQPYEFKVSVCMELCVSHGQSSYRPFITPAADPDPIIINKVRDVMRQLPPSMPRTETSGTWWHALTLAAQGAGELVSGLGIPVVSGAAGVISKLIGKLTA